MWWGLEWGCWAKTVGGRTKGRKRPVSGAIADSYQEEKLTKKRGGKEKKKKGKGDRAQWGGKKNGVCCGKAKVTKRKGEKRREVLRREDLLERSGGDIACEIKRFFNVLRISQCGEGGEKLLSFWWDKSTL